MNYSKESISIAPKVDNGDYTIQYGNLWDVHFSALYVVWSS